MLIRLVSSYNKPFGIVKYVHVLIYSPVSRLRTIQTYRIYSYPVTIITVAHKILGFKENLFLSFIIIGFKFGRNNFEFLNNAARRQLKVGNLNGEKYAGLHSVYIVNFTVISGEFLF